MLSLKSPTSRDRSMVRLTPTALLSFRPRVCHPRTRIYVRLLGPCFKTGGIGPLCQHPENSLSLGPPQGTARASLPKRAPFARRFPPRRTDADTRLVKTLRPLGAGIRPIPFPSGNFKPFSHPSRGSFHLSFTVLVRYRSLADI